MAGILILDGKFRTIDIVPGRVAGPFGIVDLSLITETEAEKLVASGFPYLERAEVQNEIASSESDESTLSEEKVQDNGFFSKKKRS